VGHLSVGMLMLIVTAVVIINVLVAALVHKKFQNILAKEKAHIHINIFILQVLMGIFYYVKSIALSEDLPGVEEGGFEKPEEFYKIADRGYVQVCIDVYLLNCLYNNVVSVADAV
jgi:hypothetical protein